jgi:hypothetical protein
MTNVRPIRHLIPARGDASRRSSWPRPGIARAVSFGIGLVAGGALVRRASLTAPRAPTRPEAELGA